MIPENNQLQSITETIYANKTYKVDTDKKRIIGTIEDVGSVYQAAQKILITERFAYLIYNTDYGAELENLIGLDRAYALSVIERHCSDALMVDNRITGILDFKAELTDKDGLTISFSVLSIEGNFLISTGVRL